MQSQGQCRTMDITAPGQFSSGDNSAPGTMLSQEECPTRTNLPWHNSETGQPYARTSLCQGQLCARETKCHQNSDRQVTDQWVNETATSRSLTVRSKKRWPVGRCLVGRWTIGQQNSDQWVTEMATSGSLTSGSTKLQPSGCWPAGQWNHNQQVTDAWVIKMAISGTLTSRSTKWWPAGYEVIKATTSGSTKLLPVGHWPAGDGNGHWCTGRTLTGTSVKPRLVGHWQASNQNGNWQDTYWWVIKMSAAGSLNSRSEKRFTDLPVAISMTHGSATRRSSFYWPVSRHFYDLSKDSPADILMTHLLGTCRSGTRQLLFRLPLVRDMLDIISLTCQSGTHRTPFQWYTA